MRYIDRKEKQQLFTQWESGCLTMALNEKVFVMEKILRAMVKKDPSILKEARNH